MMLQMQNKNKKKNMFYVLLHFRADYILATKKNPNLF